MAYHVQYEDAEGGWTTDSIHQYRYHAEQELGRLFGECNYRKVCLYDDYTMKVKTTLEHNRFPVPTPFQTFYIIWSPTGPTPPKAQHYSREHADKVCQAMAGRHPSQEFYVMEAKARAKVNNVEFVEAAGEQDGYEPF